MVDFGGPHNNQPQPDLQAFKDAAGRAGDNTQIKVSRGNVGTRSFLGRAWRAVTPALSGRRGSNMSDINSFKKSLLDPTNKQSYAGQVIDQGSRSGYADMLGAQVVLADVKAAEDKPLPAYVGPALDRFLSGDVEKAFDKFLPGHKRGKVPLTAGAVRQSIEYLDMLKTPISSAVDRLEFRAVIKEERADAIADFYRAVSNMLKGGAEKIVPWRFEYLISQNFIDPAVDKDNLPLSPYRYSTLNPGVRPVELSDELLEELVQFANSIDENVKNYNNEQLMQARDLLQKAQKEVGSIPVSDALSKFLDSIKGNLKYSLEKMQAEEAAAIAEWRDSNMRGIESFKANLLDPNNKDNYAREVLDELVPIAPDKPLPDDVRKALDKFLPGDIEKALDKFLPGRESGNVPLTAGVARDSVEYLEMLKTPIKSAVDRPELEAVIREQGAGVIVDFYRAVMDLSGDGTEEIDSWTFNRMVSRYAPDPAEDKDNAELGSYVDGQAAPGDRLMGVSAELRKEMRRLGADDDAHEYDDLELQNVRDVLQDAKKEVGGMLVGEGLSKFKGYLEKRIAVEVEEEKIGEEEEKIAEEENSTTSFSA